MNEVITTAIIGFISTLVGYVVGSRKSKAEAASVEIQNVKDVISVYISTINDLKKEVEELRDKLHTYQSHIEKLELELNSFRRQMAPTTSRKRTAKND